MDATVIARFETALADGNLGELAEELAAEGQKQVEIYDRFDQFRASLRQAGREADEDQVLDTMDSIVGWCSSPLFPHDLSNEEIEAFRLQRGPATEP